VHFESGDENAAAEAGVLRYDSSNLGLASLFAQVGSEQLPVPMGVFFKQQRAVFEDTLAEQTKAASEKHPPRGSADENLTELFASGNTWMVG